MPHAVCVTLRLKAGTEEAFMPLVLENARASVAGEPGCRAFEVCSDPARPREVFLYEIYDDAAAFDAHRDTPHYARFDGAVRDMLEEKTVVQWPDVAR